MVNVVFKQTDSIFGHSLQPNVLTIYVQPLRHQQGKEVGEKFQHHQFLWLRNESTATGGFHQSLIEKLISTFWTMTQPTTATGTRRFVPHGNWLTGLKTMDQKMVHRSMNTSLDPGTNCIRWSPCRIRSRMGLETWPRIEIHLQVVLLA